ncbi:MAG: hypothetical protein IJM37_07580 [Lachnospiraceae bacterium]|nr:hypothetical protein [Lachnospiraceae bacterium]
MKITREQEKILDSFVCERLSVNYANVAAMSSFASRRGESLVNYIMHNGLKEDVSGKTAYYVIKNERKDILMFFSLKCGALFEPLDDETEVKRDLDRLIILLQAIKNAGGSDAEADKEANEILQKYSLGDRLSMNDFDAILDKIKKKGKYLKMLSGDKEMEDNENIFRVLSTYSGIELVHFCTNDNLKARWKEYNLGHTMGEVLFWKFIAPKFFEAQKIIGCEYAFLFAADLSEDGTLVNYYDTILKFKKSMDVGTNKPFYDFCCDFMCQSVNDLRKNRQYFFDNFNLDMDDEII